MKRNKSYLRTDIFWTFDIETTTIITDYTDRPIREGIIWSGQFFNGTDYIQVRSLMEVIDQIKKIADENHTIYKTCIVVHNLSYEFEFIKDFFKSLFLQFLAAFLRILSIAILDAICK